MHSFNWKNKKKVVPIKTGIVYNREFISGLMTEIVNSIDEVKIGKNITITITPNMNCEFEEQFLKYLHQHHGDP